MATGLDASELDRLRLVQRAAGDVLFDWDVRADCIAWSDNAAASLGLRDIGTIATARGFSARIGPDDLPERALALSRSLRTALPFRSRYKLRGDDGRVEWIEERAIAQLDGQGEPVRLVGTLRVITEEFARLSRLEAVAYRDDLTGCLNRTRLRQVLAERLDELIREDRGGGFLIVNIDNLGAINVDYGYDVADTVILAICARVQSVLGRDDVLGRIGGNHLGVLLAEPGEAALWSTSELILEAVRSDIVVTARGPLAVTVSIGGLELPNDAQTPLEVFGRAAEAAEVAKRAGRDRHVLYRRSPDRERRRYDAFATGDGVLAALQQHRLCLAHQPVVRAGDDAPAFAEALLRLAKPDGELMAAGRFIPIAERLGIVRGVDRRAVKLALEALAADPALCLSVNVSGVTACDTACRRQLHDLLAGAGEVARRLIIEITETAALVDLREMVPFVADLKALGCRVALDDFGAGYTSFRHLQALDVDLVKVDGQFVQGVDSNAENRLFVDTLIRLAHGLGIEVVAERVETAAEAAVLRELGADYLQGYLFGKPEVPMQAEQRRIA